MRLVNLTPHSIDVYDENNRKVLSIPPSGIVLRAVAIREKVGEINGIPVYSVKYRVPELPEPRKGVYYIVSSVVLMLLKAYGIQRDDVLSPDTDRAVRDDKGRIVGVRGFVRMR